MIDAEPQEMVAQVWNWLPAFRAVAEAEHLPTASEVLHVTPSALSRTIALLEKELGRSLFRRIGRRIQLNPAGERLLARVRDGMRIVHHGVLEACEDTLVGPIRILSRGVITSMHVEPALENLRSSHPNLIAYVRSASKGGIADELLRGTLDLAFQSEAIDDKHIKSVYLGEASNGVYCGPAHPLFRKRKLTTEGMLKYPFIAPTPDPLGHATDGWPRRLRRLVSLYSDHMSAGIRGCEQGRFLAVLPDVIGRGRSLRRLPIEGLASASMYAMHRTFLVEESREQLLLNHVRKHIAQVVETC